MIYQSYGKCWFYWFKARYRPHRYLGTFAQFRLIARLPSHKQNTFIFYQSVDMISDVKYIHSRKNICHKEKCNYYVPSQNCTSHWKKKKYKSRDIYSAKKLKMELKDQPYEKKILQLWFKGMNMKKKEEINGEKFITNSNFKCSLVRGANGSLVINRFLLVAVPKCTRLWTFFLGQPTKSITFVYKTVLRIRIFYLWRQYERKNEGITLQLWFRTM